MSSYRNGFVLLSKDGKSLGLTAPFFLKEEKELKLSISLPGPGYVYFPYLRGKITHGKTTKKLDGLPYIAKCDKDVFSFTISSLKGKGVGIEGDIYYYPEKPYEAKIHTDEDGVVSVHNLDGERVLLRRQRPIAKWKEEETTIPGVGKYTPECPETYVLDLGMQQYRIAFYEASIHEGEFYLNGHKRPLYLIEEDFDYADYGLAVPLSLRRDRARMLRYRLGAEAILFRHYPGSDALRAYGEEGLLFVLTLNSPEEANAILPVARHLPGLIGYLINDKDVLLAIKGETKGKITISEKLDEADALIVNEANITDREIRRLRKKGKAVLLTPARDTLFLDYLERIGRLKTGMPLSTSGKSSLPPAFLRSYGLTKKGYHFAVENLPSSELYVDESFFLKEGGRLLVHHNDDYVEVYIDGTLLDVFYPDKGHKGLRHPPTHIEDFVRAAFFPEGYSPREGRKLERLLNLMAYKAPHKPNKGEMLPYKRLLRKHGVDEKGLEEFYRLYLDHRKNGVYEFKTYRHGLPAVSHVHKRGLPPTSIRLELSKDGLRRGHTYDMLRLSVRLLDENHALVGGRHEVKLTLKGPAEVVYENNLIEDNSAAVFIIKSLPVDSPSILIIQVSCEGLSAEQAVSVY